MLSARDRTLLAPHLALLRAARKELADARRIVGEAERGAAESAAETDWRDRLLGGLLSADERRARQYRQARGARRRAEKALAAAESRYEKYAERMDGLLETILARDDPAFRARLAAVRECDKVLRACENLRDRLAATVPQRDWNPQPSDADVPTWFEVESARRTRDEVARELPKSLPALCRRIERVARGLGEPVGSPLEPSAAPVTDRQIRDLRRQVAAAIQEIAGWRSRADAARVAALRAAQDRL